MKTFQQFCEQAYQLDEFIDTKKVLKPIIQTVKNITQSPTGRFARRAIQIASRGEGVAGVVSPRTGPLEKLAAGVQAVAPPGVSDAAASLRYTAMQSKPFKKVDTAMQRYHKNAYKLNPQGYVQMATGSF